jgi:hypothetical protein
MEKKPAFVYILIGLWATIGVFFIIMLVVHTTYYLDAIASYNRFSLGPSDYVGYMTFMLIIQIILYLFIVICSYIITYGTFVKKSWSWLLGIILSSFLGFYIFQGIQSIGLFIIMGNFGQVFSNLYTGFQVILFILLMFFIPIILFIMTRPYVRNYFIISSTISQQPVVTKENETGAFKRMISKIIECPYCGETQEVQGILGEKATVTCKKCKTMGVFHFR